MHQLERKSLIGVRCATFLRQQNKKSENGPFSPMMTAAAMIMFTTVQLFPLTLMTFNHRRMTKMDSTTDRQKTNG